MRAVVSVFRLLKPRGTFAFHSLTAAAAALHRLLARHDSVTG